jgi:hypothetical protein
VIGRVGEVGAWFVFVRRLGMVVVKVCVGIERIGRSLIEPTSR